MRARFVDAGGINTRILCAGEGDALILLHGVGFSADIWLRNIDALAADRQVIALDMPNHGFTDLVPYAGKLPQVVFAEHVLAAADTLGLRRFSIAGSSLGAHVAALVYFAAPTRVERLVIICSGSALSSEAELLESLPRTFANGMKAIADPTWLSCRTRIGNICFDPAVAPDEVILSQLTSYARPGMAAAYEATLKGMMDIGLLRPHRILERLEAIEVPTQLLWGRQDSRSRLENAQAAALRIRDCELVVIEECGHLPYVEHPEQFNRAVGDFLRGRVAR
jgi:2-hydroxy-6-oxonona-2,4-dienedioate hydrolase